MEFLWVKHGPLRAKGDFIVCNCGSWVCIHAPTSRSNSAVAPVCGDLIPHTLTVSSFGPFCLVLPDVHRSRFLALPRIAKSRITTRRPTRWHEGSTWEARQPPRERLFLFSTAARRSLDADRQGTASVLWCRVDVAFQGIDKEDDPVLGADKCL